MLSIICLDSARADLAEIITFIANENPDTARRLKAQLETAPLPLSDRPYLYPPGHVPEPAN